MDPSQNNSQPVIPVDTLQGGSVDVEHTAIPELTRLDHPPAAGPRYRAITHIAIVTAFLLPFAALPYALSRRRISRLSREVQHLNGTVNALQSDLKVAVGELSKRREEHRRLRTLLQDALQDVDDLKFKGKVHTEHIAHLSSSADQRVEHRNREIGKMKDDIWRLLMESHHRKSETAALTSLGTSLADIAAFMHEVELEMGMTQTRGNGDSRGIDRMRKLAAQIARLNEEKSNDDTKETYEA